MSNDTVTIVLTREDAAALLDQMIETYEFGTIAAIEAFEAAFNEEK